MQVPKGARSLSAVLNEYVVLKEQQIALNQARADVLFKGLQEVLCAYHSGNQTVHNRALPLPPISPEAIPHSSAKSEQTGMLKYLISKSSYYRKVVFICIIISQFPLTIRVCS